MIAALSLLIAKIIPIYGITLGGFLAGRHLELHRETLAKLLIYFIAPVVYFFGIAETNHNSQQLLLVPIFLCLGSLLAFVVYISIGKLYPQQERGILGFIAGSGNTGYFGIPLVAILLGPEALVAAIMVTIGLDLFQYTLGYYLMTRHNANPAEAFHKIVKNPVIWAFIAGVICMQLNWHVPGQFSDVAVYFKGAYVVLGMLVVGLGLGGRPRQKALDMRFIAGAFIVKFVLFPLCVLLFVLIDQRWLHLFSSITHDAMLLLSLVPIASDTVAFATVLGVHPQKAAHTVMLSSVFAILYVPIVALLFGL